MRAADMSVAAIGAVDYAKALDGLSLKQAQLMLTTQGIVGEEQKDLLVKQGLIATSDRMSASLVSEALANNGLNKEKVEEILIDANLMSQNTKELITENAVTEAKLRAVLAEKGIKGAKAETLISSILQTGQNAKEAISWDVLAASIKKSMIALAQNPLTWIAVAVGAVVGFIKVVDHFAITAEKLNEQLQELKATEEELISTQDKLTEIDKKIAEIQSKGTLSITDNADISRLQIEKSLLEDEIELLKIRKELQQDEYNKNAKRYADGQYSNYTHGQGDVSNLIKDYKGYKAKSERTDIDPYFVEDAKEKLKETKADLIEYRNTLNENIANLAPDDEESRKKLETIREAIEKLIYTEEELTKIKFDRFIIDPNNTGISEGFEKIKSDGEVTTQEITELASKFPTLKKFMDDNGISAEMLAAELNNVGAEAENSGGNVDKMTVSLSKLKGASENISTLQKAFKELSDDGHITVETLAEIQTATGLSGDEWNEYENKLLKAKVGSAEFKQVLSDLTYKILENEFATIDLTNATTEEITAIENKIAAVLRENGVTNANAVAHEYVRMARVNATIAAYEAGQASYDSAAALISESLSAEQAKVAMNQLELAKINVNNAKITSSDDIDNIIAIANAALASEQTLKDLAKAKAELAEGFVGPVSKSTMDMMSGTYEFDFDKLDPSDFKVGVPRYTGGSSKSSSDKNKPDYEDPTDAIINRINLRAKELEQQEESIQNAIEIAELENDYKKQISLTNDKLDVQRQKVDALKTANDGLHQMAEDLRNGTPQWNEEEWFDSLGNATEAYNRLYNNSTKSEQEKIKQQFDNISKYQEAYRNNAEEIANLNKEILQDEEKLWDTRRQIFDDRLEISENYIEHSNNFGWENGDNEIAARKRVLEWIQSDYYRSLIKDDKEYYKILEEHRLNYIEAQKDLFDKATDHLSTYYDSQKTLLQSYFDVTNSIAEAQHEINKELAASKTMYEYLNEDTRKLLFNQEDYNVLAKELIDIQSEADRLQRQYTYDLENSTLSTIEEITSQYEMQYETLMKSYEIAKADLEVAKKKAKLDNVLNERNVKMFINGQWQWVANTQDVIDAQSELADAKYEAEQARIQKTQTDSLNNLTTQQNQLSAIISEFGNGVIDLDNAVSSVTKMFGQLPIAMQNALSQIGNLSKSNSSYSSVGSSSSSASVHYATATVPGQGKRDVLIDSNNRTISDVPKGTIIHTANGDYEIIGGSAGNYTSVRIDDEYASGTRKTKSGNILIGEEPEMFMHKSGHLIPINQPTLGNFGAGGIVFNHDQMDFARKIWDWSNLATLPTSFINNIPTQGENLVVNVGDINVYNPNDAEDVADNVIGQIVQGLKLRRSSR